MVGSASSRTTSKKGRNGGRNKNYKGRKGTGRPNPYKWLYIAVAVVVAVVLGFFAWLVFAPKSGETQDAACAILVDRTGSSINPATRASYVKLAQRTIDGCRNFRGSLSVYYFDNQDAKIQTPNPTPYDLWRPKTQRQSVGEDQVDQAKKDALSAVSSVFATSTAAAQGGHGSDIVTALSLASQSLQQQAAVGGVDKKYLVVLTDGYQTGELAAKESANVQSLLRRTEQLGLTPSLKGVQVSFGGVGGGVASNKEQISPAREALVKRYWDDLVQAGGGRMCVYNVEPAFLPGTC